MRVANLEEVQPAALQELKNHGETVLLAKQVRKLAKMGGLNRLRIHELSFRY